MRVSLGLLSCVAASGLLLGSSACSSPPPSSEGGTTTQSSAAETSTSSTSAATETSTTDNSTTETGIGDDFVPNADDGFVGATDCSPWMMDCPDGEKCMPYASQGGNWDAHKCVPILGQQAPGDPCIYDGVVEATDTCDETSMCWNTVEVDGQLEGTCTPLCTGTPEMPECPPSHYCALTGEGVLTLCLQTCDPLLQECADGQGCYWTNQTFSCVGPTQNIPLGEPCTFLAECAPGLLCVDEINLPACEDAYCCASFCDLEVGDAFCDDQVPGTVCVPFFDEGEALPGYDTVGVCILPLP